MSPEERQELIAALRRKADTGAVRVPICGEAADELERLAGTLQTTLVMYGQQRKKLAALAQSDAEPAAVSEAWEKFRKEELPKPGKGAPAEIFASGYLAAQSNAEPQTEKPAWWLTDEGRFLDAEQVRPAWVEPDDNKEGQYVLCIETPAQVEIFEIGAEHFADALSKAINEHVKLYTAPPRPDASGWRQALKDAKGYIESSIFNIPSKEKTDEILSEIDTALAQSDAEPVADEGHHTLCKILRAMEPWPCKQAANEIERLARDLGLAESARDYANDVLAYAKEQLADRSEK